jgi:hypothetical protein
MNGELDKDLEASVLCLFQGSKPEFGWRCKKITRYFVNRPEHLINSSAVNIVPLNQLLTNRPSLIWRPLNGLYNDVNKICSLNAWRVVYSKFQDCRGQCMVTRGSFGILCFVHQPEKLSSSVTLYSIPRHSNALQVVLQFTVSLSLSLCVCVKLLCMMER